MIVSVYQVYVYPKTGHESSEGEYVYSSTLSLTKALDTGERSTQRLSRFTPANDLTPIVLEGGWAQSRSGWVQKISPPPEFDPQTALHVAIFYTN